MDKTSNRANSPASEDPVDNAKTADTSKTRSWSEFANEVVHNPYVEMAIGGTVAVAAAAAVVASRGRLAGVAERFLPRASAVLKEAAEDESLLLKDSKSLLKESEIARKPQLRSEFLSELHQKDFPAFTPLDTIKNPIDSAASVDKQISQLQELSRENEPIVRDFLGRVDSKLGSTSVLDYKKPETIVDKVLRKKEESPWFGVEHIRDSFRFRTTIENLQDLDEIAKSVMNSPFKVIKYDGYQLLSPKHSSGWRMAAFDLRAPNGQILEYQAVVRELNDAGKEGHKLFEQRRSGLGSIPSDLYLKAWKSYKDRTGQHNIMDIFDMEDKVARYFPGPAQKPWVR
jgi:hypothetical protein